MSETDQLFFCSFFFFFAGKKKAYKLVQTAADNRRYQILHIYIYIWSAYDTSEILAIGNIQKKMLRLCRKTK